jgi:hypothetical protein
MSGITLNINERYHFTIDRDIFLFIIFPDWFLPLEGLLFGSAAKIYIQKVALSFSETLRDVRAWPAKLVYLKNLVFGIALFFLCLLSFTASLAFSLSQLEGAGITDIINCR